MGCLAGERDRTHRKNWLFFQKLCWGSGGLFQMLGSIYLARIYLTDLSHQIIFWIIRRLVGVIGEKDFSKRFYYEGHEAITKKKGDFLFVVASCPFLIINGNLCLSMRSTEIHIPLTLLSRCWYNPDCYEKTCKHLQKYVFTQRGDSRSNLWLC